MSAPKTTNARARTPDPVAAPGNITGFLKLEGRCNYNTWKFAMEMYLTDCDLWDYVNNPDELLKNISSIEFKRQDSKARSKICLMCHENVFPLIASAKTAKDTWNTLQKEYADSGLVHRVNLLNKLFGIKLRNYPNMKAYLNDIKDTQVKLAAINASIEDEFLGVIMLCGLPDKLCSSLIVAIEHSSASITADSVTSALLKGDCRQKASGNSEGTAPFAERNKPNIKCGYCKKLGHSTNKCRALNRKNHDNYKRVAKDTSRQTQSSCFNPSSSRHYMPSSDRYTDVGATSHTNDIDWLEQVTENPQAGDQMIKTVVNKLTQENYDHSVIKLRTLLKNQECVEVAVEMVYEKAIQESEKTALLASLCKELSSVKVPAENPTSSEQYVNFRAIIINMCQAEFIVTNKIDEQVLQLEKELAECTNPKKEEELDLLINEENRKARTRSVGNVRFIGELYKLKLLTFKIIVYCMNNLIEKSEDKELESLCVLLTTAGQQVENEGKEQVDAVFKKLQVIIKGRDNNKLSRRVRFLIQDVIDLRRRGWAIKNVDSQRKLLGQVKNEAKHHQHQNEIMSANNLMGGRFRRYDSNSGNTDSYRQKTPRDSYKVYNGVVTQNTKNVSDVKVVPQSLQWSEESGTKNTGHAGNGDNSSYSKGASKDKLFFEWSQLDGSAENRPRSGSVGPIPGISSTAMATIVRPSTITPPLPQRPLTEDTKKFVKSLIDLCLINPNDDELVAELKERISPQHQAALVSEIFDIAVEKSSKEIGLIAKSMLNLVSTNTVSSENLILGINDIFEYAPDLVIDVPMLYEYLAQLITPQMEKKHVTYKQLVGLSKNIITAKQGHLLLKAIIKCSKDSMGPSFTKSMWLESELQLGDWMDTDELDQMLEDNKTKSVDGDKKENEEGKKEKEKEEENKEKETEENFEPLTSSKTYNKLLQLMSSEENCKCIKDWVRENLGNTAKEDWFIRSLIEAICEYALSGSEHKYFNQDRLNKYSSLIKDFCENQEDKEASCLLAVQELIQKLEHSKGLTFEIFQYLLKQDIISVNGFKEWEKSEVEPEGEGVMIKALVSFYASIKSADI